MSYGLIGIIISVCAFFLLKHLIELSFKLICMGIWALILFSIVWFFGMTESQHQSVIANVENFIKVCQASSIVIAKEIPDYNSTEQTSD